MNWRDITHPQAGGCELHLHEIGKRLVKAGHSVSLFCGAYDGCEQAEVVDGINIIRKGKAYTVYFYAVSEYLSGLRKNNYDVVVDDINGVPFFTPLYMRRPKIAILHHLVKEIFFKELPVTLRPIGYTAEKLIPVLYGRIPFVTVSKSTKAEMVEAGIPAGNIEIVHNGISGMFKPKPSMKSREPHIVYLGRLKTYKQLDHLVKAVGLLKERIKDVKLSIAGTGEAEDDLKGLVRHLGLGSTVKFCGFIDEDEKLRLLQSAWLFVTPSQKEGWGLTVIEANACGVPAIAYDVPGLRDSIRDGETGLLVSKKTIENLAACMEKTILDEAERRRLSCNALKWSKNFSWDKSAKKFLSILERIAV